MHFPFDCDVIIRASKGDDTFHVVTQQLPGPIMHCLVDCDVIIRASKTWSQFVKIATMRVLFLVRNETMYAPSGDEVFMRSHEHYLGIYLNTKITLEWAHK